jgi:hypothetical protein
MFLKLISFFSYSQFIEMVPIYSHYHFTGLVIPNINKTYPRFLVLPKIKQSCVQEQTPWLHGAVGYLISGKILEGNCYFKALG